MNTNRLRSKWAAVGAAVAVTLGAGGIGITHATTSSGERPIYIPIEPCRLADTRPDFQVGDRGTPLGADETYTLSGEGAVGNCNLPEDTAALSLNVTALDASAPTFVSLFPAGASLPVASHLNPLPGQGPTPNAVNVDLSTDGEFSIYNLAGTVNVIIDVVGVFDDHNHDDRYAPISENTEGAIDMVNDQNNTLTTTDEVILTATVDTPTSGYVMADATVRFAGSASPSTIRCSLSTTTALDLDSLMVQTVDSGDYGTVAMARGFVENKALIILGGDDNEMTVNVVCDESAGAITVQEGALTLTFVPDSDAFGFIFVPLEADPASIDSE
jgi:hypothetical protein